MGGYDKREPPDVEIAPRAKAAARKDGFASDEDAEEYERSLAKQRRQREQRQRAQQPAGGTAARAVKRSGPGATVRQADPIVGTTTGAPRLLAEDGEPVRPGQMAGHEFFNAAQNALIAMVDGVIGPGQGASCPYIQQWFADHIATPFAEIERLALRFSRLATPPKAAVDYIAPIVNRARAAVHAWRSGGAPAIAPELAAAGLPTTPASLTPQKVAAAPDKIANIGAFTGHVGDMMRTGVQLQRSTGVNPKGTPAKLPGPDTGRTVAVSAPGSNPYYNKHELTAKATLGVADDEPHALALAKTLGTDVAIVPSAGCYYLYAIAGQADVVAGAPLDLMPGYAENAGLRLEAGVAAVVNRYGATYRAADLAAPTDGVRASIGANADPFQAYKDLSQTKGGVNALPELELLATMRGAMVDTALSMLATSEAHARAKASQLGTPGVTSLGEHQQIEDTAKQVLAIQRDIEQRRMSMAMSAQGAPRTVMDMQQAEISQLVVQKNRLLASYPMLGRYETAFELEQFLAKPPRDREKTLAGDARSVVSAIQTTRKSIQSGDLNLWDVPPVVAATMVGLGIVHDSPQRARVKAKESAQHTKETVLNIALAVFNIGFGLAGALLTGPVGLAFTLGALGLSSYDALKTTEDHFVKNAAANTSIDPDGGLLPADAKQSWGWLVVAWGGVALSFADVLKAEKVAEEVGKVAKGGKTVAEAAEALARGDKKLLEQLRLAAGDAKVTETITEALRPGLGRRIGAEITVDGKLGADVQVLYQVDERGRTFVTAVKVGPNAKVGDILAHAGTVKALDRYSGLAGKCRDLWDRIRSFAGIGKAAEQPFEAGSMAAESYEELKKLDKLISYRRAMLQEMLEKSPSATDAQAAIRTEIAYLENEVDIHSRVVDALVKEKGKGVVAMSNGTDDALKAGHRLPDLPTKGAGELTEEELKNSAYYFERDAEGKFTLKTKLDRPGGAVEPHATTAVAKAITHQEASTLKKSLAAHLPKKAIEGLSDATLAQLDKLDSRALSALRTAEPGELEKLGKMLASDPALANRIAGRRNLLGAIKKAKGDVAIDLDRAVFSQRMADLKLAGNSPSRIGSAVEKCGLSGEDLAKLSDHDVLALGQGDEAIAKARQGFSPGEADVKLLRDAEAEFDKIGGVSRQLRNDLRAAVSHTHQLSDIPFMIDPAAELTKKFPALPQAAMEDLVKHHPDSLRALEAASQDEVQRVIRAFHEAKNPKDVEDILRSYMYKAQKKARRGVARGGTEGLEAPEHVGSRVEQSLDNLATARQRGFPFGFKNERQYKEFIKTMEDELAARGIKGKPHVQGSAMHSKAPGDIDVEILVDQPEFDRLAKQFKTNAPEGRLGKEVETSIKKGKIPSYQFYPNQSPSVADTVTRFTLGADGKQLEVQATLITKGSDFDLGPFL